MSDLTEMDHVCGLRLVWVPARGWHFIGNDGGKTRLVELESDGQRRICPRCGIGLLAQDLVELDAPMKYRCVECNAGPGKDCKKSNGNLTSFHEGRKDYVFTLIALERGHKTRVAELNTKANQTPKRLQKGPQPTLF